MLVQRRCLSYLNVVTSEVKSFIIHLLVNLVFWIMHNIDILNWRWRNVSHGGIDKRTCRSKNHGSFINGIQLLKAFDIVNCPFVERWHSWRGLHTWIFKSVALVGNTVVTWKGSVWVCCMDKSCFTRWVINLDHLMNLPSVSWIRSMWWILMILGGVHWVGVLLEDVEAWRSHDRETGLIHKQIVLVSLQVGALELILNKLPLCNLVIFPGPIVRLALNLEEVDSASLLLILELSGKQLLLDLRYLYKLGLVDVHFIGIECSLLMHF